MTMTYDRFVKVSRHKSMMSRDRRQNTDTPAELRGGEKEVFFVLLSSHVQRQYITE